MVFPYIKSTAWNAHSEHVLQTMLCSTNYESRKFAINEILKTRQVYGEANILPRKRLVPTINIGATSLENLINWSSDIHEPPLTCDLNKPELKLISDSPMSVPNFPLHGQNIERCVQAVTRASVSVYGEER